MGGSGSTKAAMVEAAPCAAMVLVEGSIIALTIMASTAMARGMSPFVFVVYTNILGSIILLPYCFFYERERSEEAILTFKFLVRVFLLGFIGITIAQNLAYVGLSYSSPIVACGMANQIPAFSFILGIILRTIKFNWKSSGSQARVLGTLISFAGAILVTLYRGPTIKNHSFPSLSFSASAVAPPRLFVFLAPHENWVLGCILFAASSFTLAIWNIVQVGTVKMCPNIMKIISFYSLFGTMQSAAVALFLERNPSAWRLDLNFELLVIVLTAIFSSLIRTKVLIWCTRWKGPYFVPAFKPFGIPYASTFGCLLFADTFHFGSMLGAFVCGVGYYTVLWGEVKDGETQRLDDRRSDSSTAEKVPLLQDRDDCEV
ncbi:WAT1-related protein At1g70260-like [Salvia miltiorrhiza]|uniref:WAT1-related protein At1g70260-like n=1 Tax=Salvia miltiorrhiza TaxID=226208 RepID=UPI0025AD1847|nr:WAT1-related protein At1g70260-like [Salvia miltiorrhiza]